MSQPGRGTVGARTRTLASALGAVGVSMLVGCGNDPTDVAFEVIEEVTFDASLGIDLAQMTKLPSGVYIQDRPAGTGSVIAAEDFVIADYTGWLKDGAMFSSGQIQFSYGLSPRELIDGLELGMEGMAVGGTRLIVVPPALAYGYSPPMGSSIPPGAILVYEIEVLEIAAFEVIEEVTFAASLGIDLSAMTKLTSGVYVEDRMVGTGLALQPADFVSVDHTAWLKDGTEIISGPFTFNYGVNPSELNIPGIELGMVGMAEGGIRLVIIPPELAFGAHPPAGSSIPFGAILVFELELLTVN